MQSLLNENESVADDEDAWNTSYAADPILEVLKELMSD